MVEASPKLSSLQLELLKIYSFQPTEEEMVELKNLLARYFAHRFLAKVASTERAQTLSDDDLDQWLEENEQ